MIFRNYNSSKQSNSFIAAVCSIGSLGGLLFGFDTAVISGTFSFIEQYFLLNEIEIGWFASSALIGAIIGALVSGSLSDRFGRKPILIIAAFLFFISALGCTILTHLFF